MITMNPSVKQRPVRGLRPYGRLRLGNSQRQVLDTILELGVCHNKQIARCLGWEIHRVSGRVSELRDLGLLERAGAIRSSETNRRVILWKLTETVQND
ncbi:MAG: hypothetical protein ACFB10_23225 [Salibacteraceae bacterium]